MVKIINKEFIENFILGKNKFLLTESSQRYKFVLLGAMLLLGAFVSFDAFCFRFYNHLYLLGSFDLILSVVFFSLYGFLRYKRDSVDMVANIALGFLFAFATMILILAKDLDSRFIWYQIFISATYLFKGLKKGIISFFIVSATFLTLYLVPFVDLEVSFYDIVMLNIAYFTFALIVAFYELYQMRIVESIKLSTQELQKAKDKMYKMFRFNDNTNLPNKIIMEEKIAKSKGFVSSVILDVDDFDIITHNFGEQFSNYLLQSVAKELSKLENENISLYNIYNRRFAFFIENSSEDFDVKFVENIFSIFKNKAISLNGISINVGFYIALVRGKNDVLSHGSLAINELKRGEGRFKIYKHDSKKEEIQKSNLYWAKRLNELIAEDNIIVYYQPIIDNKTKSIKKYECLVRAVDNGKVVSPYLFLPVAKSKGILSTITRIVIDKSFASFSSNDFDFSINITEQDLSEEYLVDYLVKKTKEYNIKPHRVFLEVLENINAQDSLKSNEQFEKLRELGFSLAIDDFGAEASNLSRLLTLKADILKIDGQFIKNLGNDKESLKIVETVVVLAKKIGLKSVAEFVHNKEVYDIVKRLGVDFSQGYYFSPPLDKPIFKLELEEIAA